MARIAGVDLPRNKRVEIALTYLFGIGRSLSNEILTKAGIDPNKKSDDLNDDEVVRITRWDFEPGAVTGMHRHGWPYFVVMLTDGNLRAEVDGVVQDRPMTAGTSYARPAGVEHDIQNGSDHPIAFVEIEVKRPDLLVMDKAG